MVPFSRRTSGLVAGALCLIASVASADYLILSNGRRIEGTILSETPDSVTIRTVSGEMRLNRSLISEMVREAAGEGTAKHVAPDFNEIYRIVGRPKEKTYFTEMLRRADPGQLSAEERRELDTLREVQAAATADPAQVMDEYKRLIDRIDRKAAGELLARTLAENPYLSELSLEQINHLRREEGGQADLLPILLRHLGHVPSTRDLQVAAEAKELLSRSTATRGGDPAYAASCAKVYAALETRDLNSNANDIQAVQLIRDSARALRWGGASAQRHENDALLASLALILIIPRDSGSMPLFGAAAPHALSQWEDMLANHFATGEVRDWPREGEGYRRFLLAVLERDLAALATDAAVVPKAYQSLTELAAITTTSASGGMGVVAGVDQLRANMAVAPAEKARIAMGLCALLPGSRGLVKAWFYAAEQSLLGTGAVDAPLREGALSLLDGYRPLLDEDASIEAALGDLRDLATIAPGLFKDAQLKNRAGELFTFGTGERTAMVEWMGLRDRANRPFTIPEGEALEAEVKQRAASYAGRKWEKRLLDVAAQTRQKINQLEAEEQSRQLAAQQAEAQRQMAEKARLAEQERQKLAALKAAEAKRQRAAMIEQARKTAQADIPKVVTQYLQAMSNNEPAEATWNPKCESQYSEFFYVHSFRLKDKITFQEASDNLIGTVEVLVEGNNKEGTEFRKWYAFNLNPTDKGWRICQIAEAK